MCYRGQSSADGSLLPLAGTMDAAIGRNRGAGTPRAVAKYWVRENTVIATLGLMRVGGKSGRVEVFFGKTLTAIILTGALVSHEVASRDA